MARRTIFNGVVAAIAILVSSVLAVGAVMAGPPADPPAELFANGLEGQAAVRSELTGIPAPLPTVNVPPARQDIASPEPEITPPTVLAAIPDLPATTPAAQAAGQSSWSLVTNDVTVTARIAPVAPQVGDTVTISYTTHGDGDVCCGSTLIVGGTVVAENLAPLGPGPCPLPRVTSWSTTVVVSQPGPFSFQVVGNQFDQFCMGPPSAPVSATLSATFDVPPPV